VGERRLKDYQQEARQFVLDRLEHSSGAGLWLNMGLGKTAVTLHAYMTMRLMGEVESALVVAPGRVVGTETWVNEIKAWDFDIKAVTIDQNAKNRKDPFLHRESGTPGELFIISCDSLPWLMERRMDFDLLIVDESTKFKNWSAKRTKFLRRFLQKIDRRITLTGTPTPNNLVEIFPQQFILDSGETLGSKITRFRNLWCRACGFELRSWEVRPEVEDELKELISPWYLYQRAVDHLDVPEKIQNTVEVEMPPKAWKTYKGIEEELFAEIDQDKGLVAITGSSRYSMLRQITGGAVYDEDKEVEELHGAKLDALEELTEILDRPLMVAYCFRHEMDRLRSRFPKIRAINGDTSDKESRAILAAWKQGSIPMLAVQPQALSHGVDGLQHGGTDLVWYTLTDRPEDRIQLEGRLHRQGVKGVVTIHFLSVPGTVDTAIRGILDRKGSNQNDLLNAIRNQANNRR
jgi:superfamily II DNA or RNA helicase